MTVAVIDYGMGNLHSVSKALETVGAEVLITNKPQDLAKAERIVLPGVGSFAQGIEHLRALNFIAALNEEVIVRKKPFLGICLGMQLAATVGEEHGINQGLGWISGKVTALNAGSQNVKVPHMGWNDVQAVKPSPLFKDLKNPTAFYFVHSYHFVPDSDEYVTGVCEHGIQFAAAMHKDNIHLVQFHPEKSQSKGLQVLENFLSFALEHA